MACLKCSTAKTVQTKFTPKLITPKAPKACNANTSNLLDQGASRHCYTILLINYHQESQTQISQLMQIYTDVTERRIHLLVYTILK